MLLFLDIVLLFFPKVLQGLHLLRILYGFL